MGEAEPTRKFGTFTGVFTPTLLTILGVIMYVRLGWVVGNAGLMGAWLLMFLAMGITACTGLSLSSIATNTRIGAGGPYAIIAKSLGYEVGGSIGVPLYLSRPLGVAMYIFGFREGWNWLFPTHDPFLIDMAVFVVLFTLAFASADLAFRVQYLIMGVIAVSLIAIVASPATLNPVAEVTWWGEYPGFPEDGFTGTSFWVVFAVFFPATTGILAGANMSGDLKDPRKAIPHGTLWAIAISSVIYFALAYWCSRAGTPKELVSNYNIMMDKSIWGPAVLAGLLGATFSSALASAVGGPRILMAMGQNNLLPKSEWLAKTTKSGEPRNAVALTALLTLGALLLRDLNAIAPLVTMFFLITYFVINVVLLLESSMNLISFRPKLKVTRIFPLLGAGGCIFVMFVINPTFGAVAVAVVVGIYFWILHRGVTRNGDDMRSGIFVGLAEWSAKKVEQLGGTAVRAWKPNLLVPVEDPALIRGEFRLLYDLCRPEGAIKLLGLATQMPIDDLKTRVQRSCRAFVDKGLFASWSATQASTLTDGVILGLQTLESAFFRPNVLFMTLPDDRSRYEEFGRVIVQARETGVGVLFMGMHPKAGTGQCNVINVWVRPDRSGWATDLAFTNNNFDLMLLTGLRLMKNWHAQLNLITVIADESDRGKAEVFLEEVWDLSRLPRSVKRIVLAGGFQLCAQNAPPADLDILGLQQEPNFDFMNEMIVLTRSSCLFVADSGRESARA